MTELEEKKAKRDEFASKAINETVRDAELLRSKYGDRFLAMFAKPATYNCLECAEDYVPRGVKEDHPMLRHVHFTTDDLEGRPDLELAINDSKRAVPHPLESIAKRRSVEATKKFIDAMRSAVDAVATKSAADR